MEPTKSNEIYQKRSCLKLQYAFIINTIQIIDPSRVKKDSLVIGNLNIIFLEYSVIHIFNEIQS